MGYITAWYDNVKPNRLSNNNIKYFRIDTGLREQKRREWNKPVLWPVMLGMMLLSAILIPAMVLYRRKERGTGIKDDGIKIGHAGAYGTSE